MPSLSPTELASRLAYDHQVVSRLRAPWLSWTAARTALGLGGTRHPSAPGAEGGQARVYLVSYDFPTLTGPGRFASQPTVVRFDLLAGGNYPFTLPEAAVTSSPLPWGPHIGTGGQICLGHAWGEARGRMLLAHLVIHMARLLNLDEPDNGQPHMNGAATAWWRAHLDSRPINPELRYPILPLDLTHGIEASRAGAAFRPRGHTAPPPGMRRRGA